MFLINIWSKILNIFKDLNDTELFRMLADRAIESTEQIDKPDDNSIENGHKYNLKGHK